MKYEFKNKEQLADYLDNLALEKGKIAEQVLKSGFTRRSGRYKQQMAAMNATYAAANIVRNAIFTEV